MGFPNLVSLAILLYTLSVSVNSAPQSTADVDSYCESWKLTVETGAIGAWDTVPYRCEEYVKRYMTGGRYLADSEFVADEAIAFAKNVTIAGDGKDSWVFDIDDTLVSNLHYYAQHHYGADTFNETSYDEWTARGVAPALPASKRVYKELQQLNFTIFLVTGKTEPFRNTTVKNLLFAGYRHWGRLILRGESDKGKTALVYKSGKRAELEAEGYRIHGCSGDQWSDLLGKAMGMRSFKIPNPMYYIA